VISSYKEKSQKKPFAPVCSAPKGGHKTGADGKI